MWRLDTQAKGDRSANVGGGIAVGRRHAVRRSPAAPRCWRWRPPPARSAGASRWAAPARSAPTIADGRLFVPTLDDQLQALATDDGRQLWALPGDHVGTAVLGLPAPAYADGLVVAGFGSGDLVALRADTGSVAWSDSLASARGRNSLLDLRPSAACR